MVETLFFGRGWGGREFTGGEGMIVPKNNRGPKFAIKIMQNRSYSVVYKNKKKQQNKHDSIAGETRIAFKKARSGSFSILCYDHTILEIYSFFKQINFYASGF